MARVARPGASQTQAQAQAQGDFSSAYPFCFKRGLVSVGRTDRRQEQVGDEPPFTGNCSQLTGCFLGVRASGPPRSERDARAPRVAPPNDKHVPTLARQHLSDSRKQLSFDLLKYLAGHRPIEEGMPYQTNCFTLHCLRPIVLAKALRIGETDI